MRLEIIQNQPYTLRVSRDKKNNEIINTRFRLSIAFNITIETVFIDYKYFFINEFL